MSAGAADRGWNGRFLEGFHVGDRYQDHVTVLEIDCGVLVYSRDAKSG